MTRCCRIKSGAIVQGRVTIPNGVTLPPSAILSVVQPDSNGGLWSLAMTKYFSGCNIEEVAPESNKQLIITSNIETRIYNPSWVLSSHGTPSPLGPSRCPTGCWPCSPVTGRFPRQESGSNRMLGLYPERYHSPTCGSCVCSDPSYDNRSTLCPRYLAFDLWMKTGWTSSPSLQVFAWSLATQV